MLLSSTSDIIVLHVLLCYVYTLILFGIGYIVGMFLLYTWSLPIITLWV